MADRRTFRTLSGDQVQVVGVELSRPACDHLGSLAPASGADFGEADCGRCGARLTSEEAAALAAAWKRDEGLEPCAWCGYAFDQERLGPAGCPNCHGEGLE